MTKTEFVTKYYPFAKQTQDKVGISAIAILAQGAVESGWGANVPGNMFFGVKASADTPATQKQLLITHEVLKVANAKFPVVLNVEKIGVGKYRYTVKDWFKKYGTPEECFTDHVKFIINNKRYAKALLVKDDPYKFIDEIAKAGYATDPNYATTLKSVAKSIEQLIPKTK